MGVRCSRECCSGPDKNGKYIGSEEDNEVVRVVSRRHPNQAPLSMVAEDAYESQLSQQNSHLLQAQNSMINSNASNNNPAANNSANQASSNNNNAIKQWANFQVVHVMDRMIQVSSTNESYQFQSLSAAIDPDTQQISLADIQGSFNSPGNTHNFNGKNINNNNGNYFNYDGQASQGFSLANNTVSLLLPSNPSKQGGSNNSTSNDQFNQDYLQKLQPSSERSTIKNQYQTNDSERTKASRNSKQPGNKHQSDQIVQGKPYCPVIYPLEAQLHRLLERFEIENDNKKSKKIVDFQPLEELITEVSATWKDLLVRVSSKLGIGPNSNLLLINNYLFHAIHHKSLKPIGETLLQLVFEQLQCQRFTLCSTGPCVLKSLAKRTGVVFDVGYNQMVFCLPVLDGKSITSQSQLLQYASGKVPNANDKDTSDNNSQNGINTINASNLNTNNMSNYNTPTFNGNNNNNAQNNNNNASSASNNSNTEFLAEVTEFLEKLDKEFLKTCLISRSFVLNSNCSNSEGIAASIVTALKIIQSSFFQSGEDSQSSIDNTTNPKPQLSSSSSVLYQSQHITQSQQQINQQSQYQTQKSKNKGQGSSQQVSQSQSWQLSQPVQLVSTLQPSVAALHGAIELIKLNVVQTVSRSRYEKHGPEEIIKSHGFI